MKKIILSTGHVNLSSLNCMLHLQYTLLKFIIYLKLEKTQFWMGIEYGMQSNIVELKNIDIIETNEDFRENILML